MRTVQNIYSSEKLKWNLLERYEGKNLEEVLAGDEIETEEGAVYRLEDRYDMPISLPDKSEASEALLSDLRLIRGIGEKREKKFKESGYDDLISLQDDERYRERCESAIREIETEDISSLQKRIERWHTMSHPNCYKLLGFVEPEDMIFFDIETMGLQFRPAFLTGVGKFENGSLKIKQYLARTLREERGVIRGLLDELEDGSFLVSFNGRSFDSRFILERMDLLGLEGSLDLPHLDLLHLSRDLWDEEVPNNRLVTLEKNILGKEREVELASAMVPNFYKMYLEKSNPGPLIPIIEHNRDDIVALALLLDEMYNVHRERD